MGSVKHTPECEAAFKKWDIGFNDYCARYPLHCRSCGGQGGEFYKDSPQPAGFSLCRISISDFTPCENCYGKSICCRCASTLPNVLENEVIKCPNCDFKFGEDEGIQHMPVCCCHLGDNFQTWATE